jgi:hypothetical protein
MVSKIENEFDKQFIVGFSTTNKIMSRIIRYLIGGGVSHAWVSFYDETLGIRLVLQAELHGLELRPWSRWLRENKLVAAFEPNRVKANLMYALRSRANGVGMAYDWWGAFKMGIQSWFRRWFKTSLFQPWRTPLKVCCSEEVVEILQAASVASMAGCNPDGIDPKTLLDTIRKSDDFFSVFP